MKLAPLPSSLALLTVLVTAACNRSSGNGANLGDGSEAADAGPDVRTGPYACNPLDPNEQSIALRHVVGIGKDRDGTLYVLDDDGSPLSYRLFQSQGTSLQLLRGSPGTSSPTHIAMDAVASAGALTLEVDVSGDVATAMGLAFGPLPDKDFVIGAEGDTLVLLHQDAVASLAVKGLGFTITYNATTPDTHRVVVMEPANGATSDLDYRIFYGTDDDMLERHLVRSGSGTIAGFDFTVDGTEYGATFVDADLKKEMGLADNLVKGGPPTLHGGTPLTMQSPSNASSLHYLCTQ